MKKVAIANDGCGMGSLGGCGRLRCRRPNSHLGDQFQYELSSVWARGEKGFFKEEGIEAELIRMNANVATGACER